MRAVLISLALASPAYAATVHVIEATPCGTVHTLHEPIVGPVLMTERGSRKYVCGDYPANPLEYIAALDLKGTEFAPQLDLFRLVPAAANPPGSGLARTTGGATWRSLGPVRLGSHPGASSFSIPHVHTATCDCGCCGEPWTPEAPEPSPVPLPASAWLLVAALGLLWRRG